MQNLETKLYVRIDSNLFTTIHFLVKEYPVVREKALIQTLTDMVLALPEWSEPVDIQ